VCSSRQIYEESASIGLEAKVSEILIAKFTAHLSRDILTRNSFLNAIVIVNILGGSTNAVRQTFLLQEYIYVLIFFPGTSLVSHGSRCRYRAYNRRLPNDSR
jgi:Dehydratase family